MGPVIFLVGPTGSGKTELSLQLARCLGAEIVSADSMLVYRGMNIGTAKPERSLRQGVRHHLIDLVSSRSKFSVYEHREKALRAIEEILRRGRVPLVVGGGGLYVGALWKGIAGPPRGNERFRKQAGATRFLYTQLVRRDPERARKIHPNDRRRILRALEIAELSGMTPSEWYRERKSLEDLGYEVCVLGIRRERQELYERINRRVETMFQRGWIGEVRRLRRQGFSKTAGQALGYREILEELRKRKRVSPGPELVPLVQKRTRHFAKRQLTWLRREKEIKWVEWNSGESVSRVCDKILKEVKPWLAKRRSS